MAFIPSYRAFTHISRDTAGNACAMWNVENIDFGSFKDNIDREDVIEWETWAHITLFYPLYGANDLESVKYGLFSPSVELVGLSCFELEDKDVLKIDVESDDLHLMHDMVDDGVDHPEKNFPEYRPHITICYLKKGSGAKYVRRLEPDERVTIKPVELLVTLKNEVGKRYTFSE